MTAAAQGDAPSSPRALDFDLEEDAVEKARADLAKATSPEAVKFVSARFLSCCLPLFPHLTEHFVRNLMPPSAIWIPLQLFKERWPLAMQNSRSPLFSLPNSPSASRLPSFSLLTTHLCRQMKNMDLQEQMAKMRKQLQGYELAMQEMTEKLVSLQMKAAGMK